MRTATPQVALLNVNILTRIVAITALEQTMLSAIRPMVTYRALAFGASPLDLGLIAAAFAVLSLLAAVVGGSWFDRRPGRLIGLVGSAIMIAGCLISLVADSVASLALGFAAFGLGDTLVIVGTQSLLARGVASGHHRDGGFGLYMAASSLGQLVGPLLGTLVVAQLALALGLTSNTRDVLAGTQLIFASSAMLCVAVALLVAGIPAMGRIAGLAPSALPTAAVLRGTLGAAPMRLAMLSSLVLSASVDVLVIYIPAYGEQQGWSIEFVGLVLTVRALAALAARLSTNWLLGRSGRSQLLVATMVASGVAVAITPVIRSGPAALVLMAVAGFSIGVGVPVTLHWVGALAPVATRGTAMGLRLAANRLGHMLLPIVAGSVGGAVGLGSVFWTLGGMLSAAAAAVLIDNRRGDPDDRYSA